MRDTRVLDIGGTEDEAIGTEYFGGWDLSNSFTSDEFIKYQCFLLIIFIIIGFVFIICYKVVKKWKINCIPEPAIAVFFGAFVSLALRKSGDPAFTTPSFNATFFFWYLLPPLIFQAGYAQDRSPFFKNWFAIMTYANLGTVISTLIFAYCLYYLGDSNLLGAPIPFIECLCFGSLISATDPVTTLSVIANLKVEGALQAMVYGSSAIDDAVAIIMYRAFQRNSESPELAVDIVATIIIYLIICLVASFLLGILFGAAAAYLFKINDFRGEQKLIICLVICLIYVSYFSCIIVEMSGIISCMFAAISFRYFLEIGKIVSKSDLKAISAVLSMIANFVETFVFFFIGMSAVSTFYSLDSTVDFRFVAYSIILALFSRVFYIYPLSYLINYFNGYERLRYCCSNSSIKPRVGLSNPNDEIEDEDTIEFNRCFPSYATIDMQHMIVFSGLRGPLALAAAGIYKSTSSHYNTIYFATLAIVLTNIFINGSLTHAFLYRLHLKSEENNNKTNNTLGHQSTALDMTRIRERKIAPTPNSVFHLNKNNVIDDDDDEETDSNKDTSNGLKEGEERPAEIDEENKNDSEDRPPKAHVRKNINQRLLRWFEIFEKVYLIPTFRRIEND